MGVRGRSLLKDYTLEQIKEVLIEQYGRIKETALKLQCSRNAIYDILDIFPELQEVREKASNRYTDIHVETAEEAMEKLIKKVDDDPSNAFKAINLVLTKSKKSRFHDKPKDDTNDKSGIEELASALQIVKRLPGITTDRIPFLEDEESLLYQKQAREQDKI